MQKTATIRKNITSLEIDGFLCDLIKNQVLFENTIETNSRKASGTFLTNELSIVDIVLDSITIDSKLLSKKILEPSCGQGIFLLRLLSNIYLKYPAEDFLNDFIANNLFFVDINGNMLDVTKKNILQLYSFLFQKDYLGKFNCYENDFTKKFISTDNSLFNSTNLREGLGKVYQDIDHVIGNPPYVTLYGRRDQKINEQQRIDYLYNYKQFPRDLKNGKINLVMLFLEHSLDLMKEGGVLSFIIDISFFETAYQHTRKYLLENSSIRSLHHNLKTFDVGSGQLVITLTKNKESKENSVAIYDMSTGTHTEMQQNEWLKPEDQYKFRLKQCGETTEIINKIQTRDKVTLKQLYPKKNLRTCTMLLDMEEKFTGDTAKTDLLSYPFYEGSKSLQEPFGDLSYKKYFYYDKKLQDSINDQLKEELAKKGIKNKKRIGFGETAVYDNPKIYIRQSAKTIIATYDDTKSASNNSLYVFTLRNDSPKTKKFLHFLCGLLNSELVTFYSQKMHIIRYAKGKQPQIKTSDLYTLRIPEDNVLQSQIAQIVLEIYNDKKLLSKSREKIDRLIYQYYEITALEAKFIRESVSNFLSN